MVLEITARIPAALSRLPELADNLFFSWHRPTRALFEALDPDLWVQVSGNPKLLLRCLDQKLLDRATLDPTLLTHYHEVLTAYDAYLNAPLQSAPLVAYFCAEYGFSQSFPIYSGGLGVLAGDHCKAASDERLNFVAVGLLYGQGYFTQRVDNDGVQHAEYRDHDPRDLPVQPLRGTNGEWLHVGLRIAGRDVVVRLWRALIGRVTLILLDTNCPENRTDDRNITWRLYGGDESMRIWQEMVLGIGGVRALRAAGFAPAAWHINEGHAAFLILELLREHLRAGLDYAAAIEAIAARCAFTTHTPVAAGHDAFHDELLVAHFNDFIQELGIHPEWVLQLARAPGQGNMFNMTRLALSGARRVNGVSRIHGAVSAKLLADRWPEVPAAENPVGYVTNGVHVPTFLHQNWADFFDRVAGSEWRDHLSDSDFWRVLERVPDQEFWNTAQGVKSDMLGSVRERLRREYARKGQSASQLRHVARWLDPAHPDVLVIGFARRFATYKRAALLLHDRERLLRLINNTERPLVFLFAGKAHPADEPGKAVLREIKQLMLQPELVGRVIFLEDYDIQLARWLVSGVDVWLNNPVAPLEASGTSGIKAAINGRLNLSILDGWWGEACDEVNGWGIPPVNIQDPARRDAMEADLIYDTLEEEVLPTYYARGTVNYSAEWVRRCKRAMMTVIPQFNMRRMVADYASGIYLPAAAQGERLAQHNFAGARELAAWKERVRTVWPGTNLRLLQGTSRDLPHAEPLRMRVAAQLNGLGANDVSVEFIARRTLPATNNEAPLLASSRGRPGDAQWSGVFVPTGEHENDGAAVFALDIPTEQCGQFAIELRMRPQHELLSHPYEMGLMRSVGERRAVQR